VQAAAERSFSRHWMVAVFRGNRSYDLDWQSLRTKELKMITLNWISAGRRVVKSSIELSHVPDNDHRPTPTDHLSTDHLVNEIGQR
jgi:hypothetical protein